MKKFLAIATASVAALFATSTTQAALVINEVFPGGGGATGAFSRDFVELYNTGTTPVNLSGYALQYSSASSTAANPFSNVIVNFGAGSVIGALDFLTVATGAAGTGATAGAPLTAANANFLNGTGGGAGLGATGGAVRLVDSSGAVVDLVGYGTISGTTGKTEGTAAAQPTSNLFSLNRTAFADSNNNSADFTSLTPTPTLGLTSVVAVPEPTTLAALAGVALVGFRRSRRA